MGGDWRGEGGLLEARCVVTFFAIRVGVTFLHIYICIYM